MQGRIWMTWSYSVRALTTSANGTQMAERGQADCEANEVPDCNASVCIPWIPCGEWRGLTRAEEC